MQGNIYGIIYLIRNKVNNKYYVGQTTNKEGFNGRYHHDGVGIERVYNYSKSREKNGGNYNKYLLRSIEKYGFEAFEVNECFDVAFSKYELDIKEMAYIQLFNSLENGYNFTKGGGGNKGYKASKETKQKLSEAMKGENNPFYGKKHTNNTKQKISESNKGNKAWNCGLTNIYSEETLKHFSETKKGSNNPSSRKVICITTGKVFDCIKDGADFYGIKHPANITQCCSGVKHHKSSGYIINEEGKKIKLVWRYFEDWLKEAV